MKARQEALDKIQKINDDKSLSDDEKNKLLGPLRETVNKSYLVPAQKLVESLSSRKTATEKQIAHFSDLLEKAKKKETQNRYRSCRAVFVAIRNILKLLLRN